MVGDDVGIKVLGGLWSGIVVEIAITDDGSVYIKLKDASYEGSLSTLHTCMDSAMNTTVRVMRISNT